MQFDSLSFVIFLVIVLSIYYVVSSWKFKKAVLLISSYLFYAAWSPPFVVLIWISTFTDYFIAKLLGQCVGRIKRKIFLIFSLVVNLGILGYFKYADFLIESFCQIMLSVGVEYSPVTSEVLLPVGISFYTFQTLSYTLDVYRKKIQPSNSLLDFSLYVTFFPQLVAGPIVRAVDFLPQCVEEKKLSLSGMSWGAGLIIFGLFQKIVLADALFSPFVDSFFSGQLTINLFENWLSVFCFSMQIYYDFAGYSLCAIGTALMLGFSLPDNFKSPYSALGFSDFWRRWHITLSSWLRDYLYISLGGDRKGKFILYRNVLITMLLGGLWHGASWNFVLWGGVHGMLLVVDRWLKSKKYLKLPNILVVLITFVVVSMVWIPFRSSEFIVTLRILESLIDLKLLVLPELNGHKVIALAVIILTLCYQYRRKDKMLDDLLESVHPVIICFGISASIFLISIFSTGDSRAFIYFQF
ncbi:MAG: MBOAT family protein [Gammaproteobacteria bacterium]|nr:MAG: MBOAT family protein [Gammaproteobacteria bacterium]